MDGKWAIVSSAYLQLRLPTFGWTINGQLVDSFNLEFRYKFWELTFKSNTGRFVRHNQGPACDEWNRTSKSFSGWVI